MNLLRENPSSVLWLLDCNPLAKANLLREAEKRGVASPRLNFAPRVAIDQHLARQQLADLFLDTLPYNAHTTTSDALWVGLPVITCPGQTFASRVAGSLLHAAGVPQLATDSLQTYESLAQHFVSHPDELHKLREKLLATRDHEPLFDTRRFTRNVENAYREMWRRWLASGIL